MGFLRRLLGGTERGASEPGVARSAASVDAAEIEADERSHELEVLREEQARLDELAQRQLRYADYAWTPPRQGGDRRADDQDREEEG
jgi:hypothetical protein